jgi:preprotein translocase subunit SecY
VNAKALEAFFGGPGGRAGGIFGLYDLFVGGAFQKAAIFATGIMPYITSSIVFQLLGAVFPYFQKLQKEGEQGRRKLNQYTRYGTVVVAAFQSIGISVYLQSLSSSDLTIVTIPGFLFNFLAVLTLTTGACMTMWLAEQMTEYGIGNGMSILITVGIVARMPLGIIQEIRLVLGGAHSPITDVFMLIVIVAFTVFAILLTQGTRQIPVTYPKRIVGRKMYRGQSVHLPLKINAAGVIPIIFAQSVMFLPAMIVGFLPESDFTTALSGWFSPMHWFYNLGNFMLIVFFAYFYTAVIFNPVDVAENIKKYGGTIPGRSPGKETSQFIDRVLTRVTLPGAVGLGLIAVLPVYLIRSTEFQMAFGGTSLLIIVGVQSTH